MNPVQFLKQNKQLSLVILLALMLLPPSLYMLHHQQSTNTTISRPIETTAPPLTTMIPTVYTVMTVTPAAIDPQKKLLDLVQNRRPLSQADQNAKAKILSNFPQGQDSGVVYKTSTISVEYVHSPDLFQVDILTNNISAAKAEAVAWFQKQGMSQQGICSLPLTFYLDFQINNQQKGSFNPLPEGC
jgi:hypothetical protein